MYRFQEDVAPHHGGGGGAPPDCFVWIKFFSFLNFKVTMHRSRLSLSPCSSVIAVSRQNSPPHTVLFRVRICVFDPAPFSFVIQAFSAPPPPPPPPPPFSISLVCKVNTGRPFSFVTSQRVWEHTCGGPGRIQVKFD